MRFAGDDPARLAVDEHDVEQLVAVVHGGAALRDLALERRVGAQEELLAGLPAAVERSLDEDSAERAGRQHPAVLAVERDALGDRLVDDVGRGLGEPPDVRLAGAEVSALDRVDEEALDRVALVRVVLGRVDAALRRDRVGATRRVLEAERVDGVALAGKRRRGARARQPGADDDHAMVGALARPDQAMGVEPVVPLVLDRALRDAGVECRHPITPVQNAIGTAMNPPATPTATIVDMRRKVGLRFGLSQPPVWKKLQTAWRRWNPRASAAVT